MSDPPHKIMDPAKYPSNFEFDMIFEFLKFFENINLKILRSHFSKTSLIFLNFC